MWQFFWIPKVRGAAALAFIERELAQFTVWKLQKITVILFWQIFRETYVSTKKLNELLCKNEKYYKMRSVIAAVITLLNSREINSLVTTFVKFLDAGGKMKKLSTAHWKEKFVKSTL